jgi:hypothetical protein
MTNATEQKKIYIDLDTSVATEIPEDQDTTLPYATEPNDHNEELLALMRTFEYEDDENTPHVTRRNDGTQGATAEGSLLDHDTTLPHEVEPNEDYEGTVILRYPSYNTPPRIETDENGNIREIFTYGTVTHYPDYQRLIQTNPALDTTTTTRAIHDITINNREIRTEFVDGAVIIEFTPEEDYMDLDNISPINADDDDDAPLTPRNTTTPTNTQAATDEGRSPLEHDDYFFEIPGSVYFATAGASA